MLLLLSLSSLSLLLLLIVWFSLLVYLFSLPLNYTYHCCICLPIPFVLQTLLVLQKHSSIFDIIDTLRHDVRFSKGVSTVQSIRFHNIFFQHNNNIITSRLSLSGAMSKASKQIHVTHAHAHARARSHTHTYTHTHIHTRARARARTHTHTPHNTTPH